MNPETARVASWSFPRIGLGTAHWRAAPSVTQRQIDELVRLVLAGPTPFFDTAPLYGNGASETWLGRVLAGVPRANYLLATKAGYAVRDGRPARHDLSRDGILRSVEVSLKRLQVDVLDICHLHDADDRLEEALDTALPTLVELRDQGVIRAVGAGMNHWQMPLAFAQREVVDCFLLAGRYTLLDQGALSFLDTCQAKGLPVFLGGVYNSGILVTGPRPNARYNYATAPAHILERASKLDAACARHGVTLQAAALQFPLAHPAVRCLVIGANSAQEYLSALSAVEHPIPAGLWDELHLQGQIDDSSRRTARPW